MALKQTNKSRKKIEEKSSIVKPDTKKPKYLNPLVIVVVVIMVLIILI